MTGVIQIKYHRYNLGLEVYSDDDIEIFYSTFSSLFEFEPVRGIRLACDAKSITPFLRIMERFPFFCQFTYLEYFFKYRRLDRMLDYVLNNIEGWEDNAEMFKVVKDFSWKYNYVKGQEFCGDFEIDYNPDKGKFNIYFSNKFSEKFWSIEQRYRLLERFAEALGFSRDMFYGILFNPRSKNGAKNYAKLLELFPDKAFYLPYHCFLPYIRRLNFEDIRSITFPKDKLLWLICLMFDSRLLMDHFMPESPDHVIEACLEIMRGEDTEKYKTITFSGEAGIDIPFMSLYPISNPEYFAFAAIHYRNVPVLRWLREWFVANPSHNMFRYFKVNDLMQQCPVSIEFVEEIKLFCEQCKPYFSPNFDYANNFGNLFFLTDNWDYFVAHRDYELIPAASTWLGSVEMMRRSVEVYDHFKWEKLPKYEDYPHWPWGKQIDDILIKIMHKMVEVRPHFDRENIRRLAVMALHTNSIRMHEWLCALLDE